MPPWASRSFDFFGDPVDVLECFRGQPYPFLLESSLFDRQRGRFSFLGFDPGQIIRGSGAGGLQELRQRFGGPFPAGPSAATPFPAGWAGYVSYDHGLRLEGISPRPDPEACFPEFCFGFYDCVITIDHALGKLHVCSAGSTRGAETGRGARQRLDQALQLMSRITTRAPRPPREHDRDARPLEPTVPLTSNLTCPAYLDAVRRAQKHIRAGDVYQVNLSQRFSWDLRGRRAEVDPLGLYRRLRQLSPSCCGGYFDGGSFQIISSSPERLVQLRQRTVQTRPMKGTRPRGKTPQEDRQQRADLLCSQKDQAELLMITDLERNDLGRVCEYGSVRVRTLRTIEDYRTVFQATSTVEGTLEKGKDALDLLAAAFPGGSVTGCPKIRAMQVIDELEPDPRGIYTGSLGYLSVTGDMDFNILIRTMVLDEGKVQFHAGGGIVADSVPEQEYQETLDKAWAMRLTLESLLKPERPVLTPGQAEAIFCPSPRI